MIYININFMTHLIKLVSFILHLFSSIIFCLPLYACFKYDNFWYLFTFLVSGIPWVVSELLIIKLKENYENQNLLRSEPEE